MIGFLRRLSLQSKLLVSFVVVVALATVIGYLFINHSVKRAFSDFTVRSLSLQDRIVLQLIVGYYNRTGSFDGLVDLLEQTALQVPILLVDPSREVVFSPDERYLGRRLSQEQLEDGQMLTLPGGETWTLVPFRATPERDVLEEEFLRTTGRSLWLAGLAAGAAGLLIAFFLLRQVTGPLKRLDAAAGRIAEGRFGERVNIVSSDEIGHLAHSFNEMATSLEGSERAKRQMIADISHELRTPLTSVRTALEGLRDGVIDPSQQTFAALHDRILLLTRLVADLHQLALADAGRLSIRRTSCHVELILDGIVETIGVQLEDAGLSLVQSIDPNLPSIDGDPHRIEQVLLNLLANAIRHTPEGGTIKIGAVRTNGDVVQISVCDSGPGLSPAELPFVFDRFYRADSARTRFDERSLADRSLEMPGAGLGLPIAKAIVEAHGGRIWAENAPGAGACFRFTLPAPAPPAPNEVIQNE